MEEKAIIVIWGQETEAHVAAVFPQQHYHFSWNTWVPEALAQVVLPSAVAGTAWQQYEVISFLHNPLLTPYTHSLVVNTVWWKGLHTQALEAAAPLPVQEKVLQTLPHVSFTWSYDVPGLVGARTIAMIINEAFFALEENVASEADMNTAMRLGTNYPYGPFEWGRLIGLHHVAELLVFLQKENALYKPSSLLLTQAQPL